MQEAIKILMQCLKRGLKLDNELFKNLHFHFIGTSYAPKGKGVKTLSPIAEQMGVSSFVTEYTDRIGFYESLKNLQQSDGLIIIGSNEVAYNASKLYPFILSKKPLLSIFHQDSVAASIITTLNAGSLITLDFEISKSYAIFKKYIEAIVDKEESLTKWDAFKPYTAAYLTQKQIEIFNMAIS